MANVGSVHALHHVTDVVLVVRPEQRYVNRSKDSIIKSIVQCFRMEVLVNDHNRSVVFTKCDCTFENGRSRLCKTCLVYNLVSLSRGCQRSFRRPSLGKAVVDRALLETMRGFPRHSRRASRGSLHETVRLRPSCRSTSIRTPSHVHTL